MIYKWQLAVRYYPDSPTKKAATTRLRYAIDHCRTLKRKLKKGPQNRNLFYPSQVQLICEYLGEPND